MLQRVYQTDLCIDRQHRQPHLNSRWRADLDLNGASRLLSISGLDLLCQSRGTSSPRAAVTFWRAWVTLHDCKATCTGRGIYVYLRNASRSLATDSAHSGLSQWKLQASASSIKMEAGSVSGDSASLCSSWASSECVRLRVVQRCHL